MEGGASDGAADAMTLVLSQPKEVNTFKMRKVLRTNLRRADVKMGTASGAVGARQFDQDTFLQAEGGAHKYWEYSLKLPSTMQGATIHVELTYDGGGDVPKQSDEALRAPKALPNLVVA